MVDSVHLARWASNLVGYPAEFFFLGLSPYRRPHSQLIRLSEENQNITLIARPRMAPVVSWVFDRFFSDVWRGLVVYQQIKAIKPDLIHVNQLQMGGYPVLRALKMLKGSRAKLWSTNYGSEMTWYLRKLRHKGILRSLLQASDFFSAECQRDFQLASSAGFSGQPLECIPVSGSLETKAAASTAERRFIAVKAYQTKWGLGLPVLRQVANFIEDQKKYEIFAFSCTLQTFLYCWYKKRFQGLRVTYFYKGSLDHNQVLAWLAKSEFYIGASRADGISTSMIEAMSQGAYPIQTNTSCAAEWLTPQSGRVIDLEEIGDLCQILRWLTSDEIDLQSARSQNFQVIANRLNANLVKKKIWSSYDVALA